jgi:antitoxin component YwqK of YwqJK toxin-antitoxin module
MQKFIRVLTAGVVLIGVSSCARRLSEPEEVIDQSYIHRYGLAVEPEEWSAQGQSGQVVTTLKSGVVVTRGYSGGDLDGETNYTFPHSDLLERTETYEIGKLKKETYFYRNSTTSKQVVYASPHTKLIYHWYDNGAPKSIETYQDGEVLVKGDYYNLDHQSDSRVENFNGVRTNRDPFGLMIGIETIANGSAASAKTFYPNGSVKQETPYANGQIQGLVKNYLPDGVPSSIETWQKGERTGPTQIFENGELAAEVPYVRGVKDGMEKRYRNGKVLVEQISWVSDTRYGPSTTYIGDVAKTDYFYQGNLVSKTAFDKFTNGGNLQTAR